MFWWLARRVEESREGGTVMAREVLEKPPVHSSSKLNDDIPTLSLNLRESFLG
jgi:hypothetical protein